MKAEQKMEKICMDEGTIVNALSVDLEDWYHVCGVQKYSAPSQWPAFESRIRKNTEKVLTLLSDFKVKATFFILGYIAEKSPSLVKEIAAQDHEIASHSYHHKRLFDMEPKDFEDDLKRSLDCISSLTDRKVTGFRAPEWSMRSTTLWALDILKAHKVQYDSSMVPLSAMGSNRFPRYPCMIKTQVAEIMEFPLTTTSLFRQNIPFTGGFPLREWVWGCRCLRTSWCHSPACLPREGKPGSSA